MLKIFLITVCITLMCSGVFAQDFDPEHDSSEWEGYEGREPAPKEFGPPPPAKEKPEGPTFGGKGFTSEDTLPEDPEGDSTSSLWGFFSAPSEEKSSGQEDQ